jgi:membrane-associated phospholipid phosphatase
MNSGAVLLLLTLLSSPATSAQQPQDTPAAPPASITAPQPSTLGGAIRALPQSARHLADRSNLIVLASATALALSLTPADAHISRTIAASPMDTALSPGDVIGNGYTQFAVALGTLAAGQLSHKRTVAATGADLLDAQIINGIATQGIKYAVDRQRPDGGHHSFPSGHTSATFATATVIQRRFGWKAGVPLYALGGYVAASRLQQNHHYLSDVVFGAALGIVAGRASVHVSRAGMTASFVPLERGIAVVIVRTAGN